MLESLLAEGLSKLGENGEVRGAGLLRGLRLDKSDYDGEWCGRIIKKCREEGLIILKTGKDVLRLAPPLVISDEELEEGVALLFSVIQKNL